MAFVQAMNSINSTKTGINGADVYTEEGVGDYRVSLFTMLNRGLEDSYIDEYISKIYNRQNIEEICDLFVMAFQTRDIRGGKGERKLFYQFMKTLYKYDKESVFPMLYIVPEYGCWRDMWEIIKLIPDLEIGILEIVKQTFKTDLVKYNAGLFSKISLLSKWLPRENSGRYPGLARKLANYIYSFEESERKRIVKYRKDTSMLNKALKTVEINMCGGFWSEIKPETVPGRCLKKCNKAFLNESLKNTSIIRFPDSEDRMKCREKFQEFAKSLRNGTKKAHGANVILPHELILMCLEDNKTDDELAIIQGQWNSIREETLKLGGLGKSVPMCDFSGSMDGLPMSISLALGILVSEINHNAFKDHILTFDTDPKWHSFIGMNTLDKKIEYILGENIGIGLNTDFYKACKCIIQRMVDYKVPAGEEPENLIVFTDMGFDAANHNSRNSNEDMWETQLTTIQTEFKIAGEKLWGEGNGWKPPRIVIWNLSAQYKDFHAKADQEGVVQLSGWSPSILKALQTSGITVKTPYEGMRAILDNPRYDQVRNIWKESIITRT
jgi:hypothetical protein